MASQVLIYTRDADVLAERLRPQFPDVVFLGAMERAQALTAGVDCDVLMVRNDEWFDALPAAMPKLRFLQALTTGTDAIEAAPMPQNVTIAAARGFHGPQMSELAFLFMLGLARDFPSLLQQQKERRWHRAPQKLLTEKTLVILGVGRIAEELARRAKVFGMTVIGVSGSRATAPGFDSIFPRPRLVEAAAMADFLVVLVPSTVETRGVVDATVLAAMKPSAFLVNLARGEIVDEPALIEALSSRRIAGAGLDVFQTEPLPAEHPFWRLDNVLITPHIGGMSDIYAAQVMPIVADNLTAYLAGAPDRMRYVIRTSEGSPHVD